MRLNKTYWEIHHQLIKSLVRDGENVYSIAKKLNICYSSLRRYLKRTNILVADGRNSQICFDKSFFNTVDTEAKAYWLGFLYADGYISSKRKYLSITLSSKDRDHLLSFRTAIKSSHKILERPPRTSAKTIKGRYISSGPSIMLNINNKEIVLALERLGCVQCKSLILKFPTVQQVPDSLLHHFIRGYFDGDGWIQRNKRYIYVGFCGNYDFCFSLKQILEFKWNIKCSNIMRGSPCRVLINRKNAVISFYNIFFSQANIYLERKGGQLRNYERDLVSVFSA